MDKLSIKTPEQIATMAEGGKKLHKIKNELRKKIKVGATGVGIELLANSLIKESGGEASFVMVPGYSWATCINTNQGIVHGIPNKERFKEGDVVSVDIGLYYKEFHTDTSFTVYLGDDPKVKRFLEAGEKGLHDAIKTARPGKRIYDISLAMQQAVEKRGYSVAKTLVGHGIGKKLHEEPQVPNFVSVDRKHTLKLADGLVLALEIMFTMGKPDLHTEPDGWTISASDGKLSGLYEETVAITKQGPIVLT